jgi:hypothetical protein
LKAPIQPAHPPYGGLGRGVVVGERLYFAVQKITEDIEAMLITEPRRNVRIRSAE